MAQWVRISLARLTRRDTLAAARGAQYNPSRSRSYTRVAAEVARDVRAGVLTPRPPLPAGRGEAEERRRSQQASALAAVKCRRTVDGD